MIPFYSLDPETSPEPWFKDFVEGVSASCYREMRSGKLIEVRDSTGSTR